MIWASLLLLLPAWGLQPDLPYDKIPNHLILEGSSAGASWTKFSSGEQLTLRYECDPKLGCSTHPSSAVFEFEKGQLISATLDFSRELGPSTSEIRDLLRMLRGSLVGLLPVVAVLVESYTTIPSKA